MRADYSDVAGSVFHDGREKYIPSRKLLDIVQNRVKLYLSELESPLLEPVRTQVVRGQILEARKLEKALKELVAEVSGPEL